MRRKRLLAILSRYLWPVDGGRKESLNHYFKELHDNYGYDIKLLCFLEYGQKIERHDLPDYIKDAAALQDAPALEKVGNVMKKSIGKTKWPFQCAFYYSTANRRTIESEVAVWKPDVIFTEMIRTCSYYDAFKNSGALLLANLDDLLSVRYKRQTQSGRSKASFAGSYSNKLSGPAERILNSAFVKRLVLNMEAKRCDIWEKKFYSIYDYTLMTSDVERDALNRVMGERKAKTLSVGIDYEYYSQSVVTEPDPIGLSYHGNFNVAANADTLEMIIREVLPHIQSDYHFYIIGRCPDKILQRYKDNQRLLFCGCVDDLREYVKRASIYLAPIAYGTGVKTKIVEAMAMNMAVITNSVGAEGIYAEHNTDYIVCDDPKEIAGAADELLNDNTRVKAMGRNAGKFAYEHFRWEKILAVYRELGV